MSIFNLIFGLDTVTSASFNAFSILFLFELCWDCVDVVSFLSTDFDSVSFLPNLNVTSWPSVVVVFDDLFEDVYSRLDSGLYFLVDCCLNNSSSFIISSSSSSSSSSISSVSSVSSSNLCWSTHPVLSLSKSTPFCLHWSINTGLLYVNFWSVSNSQSFLGYLTSKIFYILFYIFFRP